LSKTDARRWSRAWFVHAMRRIGPTSFTTKVLMISTPVKL
jgi:hypothetical protein